MTEAPFKMKIIFNISLTVKRKLKVRFHETIFNAAAFFFFFGPAVLLQIE